uniref:Kinesin-like protein n=1 Tax=Globodera rostochiensis TaxID=31243 RepID=A0A914HTZ6_GLORO
MRLKKCSRLHHLEPPQITPSLLFGHCLLLRLRTFVSVLSPSSSSTSFSSVLVAVRVLAIQREKKLKAQRIARMLNGKVTYLRNPTEKERQRDQKCVFDNLGVQMLQNAWAGYNCAINESSSRAHTIVRVEFTQNCGKPYSMRTSEINLVDLAGSERLKGSPNDGERLREDIRINQSLSTLGRVIKALYDQQNGKGTDQQIATISPANVHYEETLSTLRLLTA